MFDNIDFHCNLNQSYNRMSIDIMAFFIPHLSIYTVTTIELLWAQKRGDEMKPIKVGRPVSVNPKDKTVKIRMDSEEIKVLDDCVKRFDLSRSYVIRQGISKIYSDLKQ